jgi:hypothetical protein
MMVQDRSLPHPTRCGRSTPPPHNGSVSSCQERPSTCPGSSSMMLPLTVQSGGSPSMNTQGRQRPPVRCHLRLDGLLWITAICSWSIVYIVFLSHASEEGLSVGESGSMELYHFNSRSIVGSYGSSKRSSDNGTYATVNVDSGDTKSPTHPTSQCKKSKRDFSNC